MSCEIHREQDEFVCRRCARRWGVGESIDCSDPLGRDVPFTEQEMTLFNHLCIGEDISIPRLWRAVDATNKLVDIRDQQMRLGAIFSRMNRKLVDHKLEIVVGVARNTYTLKRV